MADETERIVVEVDGERANQAFLAMARDAGQADAALDRLGQGLDRLQYRLNVMGGAGQTVAAANTQVANTANAAAAGVNNAGNAAANATNHFNALQQSLFGIKGKAAFIWDLAIDGFKASIGFAETFIERISAMQRTMSLLSTIPGSDKETEFGYLRSVADNYGLSLRSIQDDYSKLSLAAQSTTLSQEGVRRVFEQTSMATRTLHLNTQQTQLTFLALEQMLSKGKVSMEELRKQFAERIPGAMQAFADELGVPIAVLNKFITTVGMASDKAVPALGNAIQRLYQGGILNASQALDAQVNRIQTSISAFYLAVLNGGGAEGMTILLRQLNDMLQSDTIATTFSNAMNRITNSITDFLRELKPDDIEKFGEVALDFLASFAKLAMAAANAIIFLGQHIPETAAAFGAFMGASALAPMGPWGVALGAFIGGVSGYMGGQAIQGSSMGSPGVQEQFRKLQSLDAQIAAKQANMDSIDEPIGRASSMGELANNALTGGLKMLGGGTVAKGALSLQIQTLQKERTALAAYLDPMLSAAVRDQSPTTIDLPPLDDKLNMIKDPKKAMDFLRQNYGINSGEETKEQKAARLLAERQDRFIEDMASKLARMIDPEGSEFSSIETNARQIGITPGNSRFDSFRNMQQQMQTIFNKKKQDASDAKTQATERQFDTFTRQSSVEKEKFGEQWSLDNLKQVDDMGWQTKARQMKNLQDKEIAEFKKKRETEIAQNPLFAIGYDLDKDLAQIRAMGDAYIAEFKRIEQEKRSVFGGSKQFLKEWNENATNFGQITQDFLKGVADGTADMLVNLVKTGEFSFKKLGTFVLDYMIKMLVVQSMTPFVNSLAGPLSTLLASVIGAPVGATAGAGAGDMSMLYRAEGGPVSAGQSYWVGERGMEKFTPVTDGWITPNHAMNGGGGNTNIQINVAVDSKGDSSTTTSGEGVAALGRKLSDAVRSIIIDEKRPGGLLNG